MDEENENKIIFKVADIRPFKLPVQGNEKTFYRTVVQKINEKVDLLRYGVNADSTEVAVAKVAIYYAAMFYRRSSRLNSQAKLLEEFEKRLDGLLAGTH